MDKFVLKNENLSLTFNKTNGALVKLTAVNTNWDILDREELGLSFRLMVPMPGKRNNAVFGEKQQLTTLKMSPDKKSVNFTWDHVVSEFGDCHNIKVELEVALSFKQAVYKMTIVNNSEYTVENVYCPYLGDVKHPEEEKWFKSFFYKYATAQEWSLWPTYQNSRGYYGIDYPTQFSDWGAGIGAPMAPYILLRGAKQGLYVGITENSSELVAWQTELRPGYDSSIDSRVPLDGAISGKTVATRFAAVHAPYILSGEIRTLTPVALEAYEGGWQQGVDIYKEWLRTWLETPKVPAWAAQPHSWLQLHINSPEDELRIKFTELYKIGEECAKHGVGAIQLVGWNDGGQDQGNPSHNPDPRLGTFEELQEAIKCIQGMGVKLILFAKFTWADRATERFRKDLIRLAIKDPYGDYYMHQGYQYQTATQLMDINTKRLIPMCFLSEEYLSLCNEEFMKTVKLGADGILFDECLHHANALLCFDETHGHRYGAPVYANDRKLIENFSKLIPGDGNFLFAGEACYDWEFEAYHLSYHRSESKEHIPLSRYVSPKVPLMTAVTGFNDRNMINQCLMYNYIISYEPYNFKGHLEDYPLTLEYGKKMDDLRKELKDYLWDGEFRHECGALVSTFDGKEHHPYAVFENHVNNKIAVVIANYEDASISVTVQLEKEYILNNNLNSYRLIDGGGWKSASGGVVIPPRSAAVLIEK
jgi:hypothetical protein